MGVGHSAGVPPGQVDGVMEEANPIPGYERTVRDVLSTMADRNLLKPVPGAEDRYVPGAVLIESE